MRHALTLLYTALVALLVVIGTSAKAHHGTMTRTPHPLATIAPSSTLTLEYRRPLPARLASPPFVTALRDGTLAVPQDDRIALVHPDSGAILRNLTVLPPALPFSGPCGLASDFGRVDEHIYVGEQGHSCVRKIRVSDGMQIASAPRGDEPPAPDDKRIKSPLGVAVGAGRVFVGDVMGYCVHIFKRSSLETLHVITKSDLPSETRSFNPHDVAVYGKRLYVADADESSVWVFTLKGQFVKRIGSYGTGPLQFIHPRGLLPLGSPPEYLVVVERGRLQLLTPDGNSSLQLLDPPGVHKTPFGSDNYNMMGATYDEESGNIYVADTNDKVHVFGAVWRRGSVDLRTALR